MEEYKRRGLEINIEKTQNMMIEGTQRDVKLEYGRVIGDCQEYKYLELKMTWDGTLEGKESDTDVEWNFEGPKHLKIL